MAQERLLAIAIDEFGLKGLDGASTRGIAAKAGTAMSAITYHYGGKQGLYLAAADCIAGQMAAEMAPALVAERVITRDDAMGARAAIHRILSRFVDKMVSDTSKSWAMFLMREQLDPTKAFDRIYAGVMGQMLERVAELIGIATGAHDRTSAGVATMTLIGQALALRSSRAAAMRLLDWASLDEAAVAVFRRQIELNTDAIIDAMIAKRQGEA